jgi:DNA (cytosine-5)-methyltransferase 1
MKYLSVCSGVEAASLAWHPLGWEAAAFSEIDNFPRAVLAHRFPEVPLRGDFTEIKGGDYGSVDILVGGTPCQSFSIAGLRGGLGDRRGNLAIEFLKLARRVRARWVVWENVPGVLSSSGGRDFGTFLAGLGECGYGWAYRTLDAQYFGVPQRRRRVFVVGHLGDWRRAAAVLFERDSLSGHPPPRREAGPGVAALTSAGVGTCGAGDNQAQAGHLIAFGGNNTSGPIDVATACNAKGGTGRGDFETETFVAHALRGEGFDASEDGTGRGTPLVPVAYRTSPNCGAWETGCRTDALTTSTDPSSHIVAFTCKDHGADAGAVSPTLRAMGHGASHANAGGQVAVAQAYSIMPMNSGRDYKARETSVAQPVMAGGPVGGNQGGDYIVQSAVRRLTPRECERLQGMPDDWTRVPYRGKPAEDCPDGPRYKAIGNSMAVPVMRWIGERISLVDRLATQ